MLGLLGGGVMDIGYPSSQTLSHVNLTKDSSAFVTFLQVFCVKGVFAIDVLEN